MSRIKITTYGQWWRGEIAFKYDLAKLLFFVLAIIALGVAGFAAYWLVIGLWAALKWIWSGLVALSSFWPWILGGIGLIGLIALIVWLVKKIKWPKRQDLNWRLILTVLAFVVALALFCIIDRSSENKNPAPSVATPVAVVTPERFNEVFDWVVTSRAYLDGVQKAETNADRALVGLKFVDGRPVTDTIFEGKTYDEAVRIIAEDWRDLMLTALNGVSLSENQLIAATLFAMRNGKYGFMHSDFLKEVQSGRIEGAESLMALHKADGTKRQLGDEARQYLWVLMQIYNGNVDYKDLLDMPIMSYRALYISQIYTRRGKPRFSESALSTLQHGTRQTPREALEL